MIPMTKRSAPRPHRGARRFGRAWNGARACGPTLKGGVKTENRWQLVLTNVGDEPARKVTYRLEAEKPDDNLPHELDDTPELEVLAPHSDAAYTLLMYMGVADQARCSVKWEDSEGERENVATLRFF